MFVNYKLNANFSLKFKAQGLALVVVAVWGISGQLDIINIKLLISLKLDNICIQQFI